MKKKKLLAFLLAAAMVCQSGLVAFAQEPAGTGAAEITAQTDETAEEPACKTYLDEERTYAGIGDRYAIPEEDVEFVKGLGSATITVSCQRAGKRDDHRKL